MTVLGSSVKDVHKNAVKNTMQTSFMDDPSSRCI